MFDKIPDYVRLDIVLYEHEILEKKTRMKGFRGIIKEGIYRWWKSDLFVFKAIMLKYKHLKCHFDFFQLYNDFEGEF
jgi:hypothetical protein